MVVVIVSFIYISLYPLPSSFYIMKSLTVLYTLALVILFISTVSAASFNKQRYVRGSKQARVTTTKKTTTTTKKTTVKATATIPKATTITAKSSTTAAPTSPAGSGTVYSGDGTWFNIGLGSCGQVNTDDELVAALNAPQMMNGANPNNNPMCGRMIKVTNPATNKSVTVKIVSFPYYQHVI